jgi:hypothetical protein
MYGAIYKNDERLSTDCISWRITTLFWAAGCPLPRGPRETTSDGDASERDEEWRAVSYEKVCCQAAGW